MEEGWRLYESFFNRKKMLLRIYFELSKNSCGIVKLDQKLIIECALYMCFSFLTSHMHLHVLLEGLQENKLQLLG